MKNRPPVLREPRLTPTRPRSPSEALEPARAPARPTGTRGGGRERRGVGSAVRVTSGLLTIVLLTMAAAGGLSLLLYHHLERPGPLEVSRTVTIPKGEGAGEIGERLEREGIISSSFAFKTVILSHRIRRWFGSGKSRELKAGEYEFKKNASMREVLDTIAEGKSVLSRLTIPEGLTSRQIVERLREDENLAGEIAEIPPEGTLLPDTYSFSKGMPRQELLTRMRIEQERLIAKIWEKRQPGLPVDSAGRAIILASIVEKETGRPDERDRVAAVFVNRLRKRMRLQSDPTIIYGIAPGQGSLGRPITRDDIDGKTAYNTYQIDGLPPTPISNPGRSAIEATLNPAKTNDLYFVAAGDGGHTFSEKYEDHRAAVAAWRKTEKENRAKQEQQAAAGPAAEGAGEDAIPAPGPGQAASGGDGLEPDAAPVKPGEPAANPAAAAPALKAAAAANIPLPIRKPKR